VRGIFSADQLFDKFFSSFSGSDCGALSSDSVAYVGFCKRKEKKKNRFDQICVGVKTEFFLCNGGLLKIFSLTKMGQQITKEKKIK
jgi:hypothetical protein